MTNALETTGNIHLDMILFFGKCSLTSKCKVALTVQILQYITAVAPSWLHISAPRGLSQRKLKIGATTITLHCKLALNTTVPSRSSALNSCTSENAISMTGALLEAQMKLMLCNLALSFHESPANRKFQELNLFLTLDLFPLVSSEKMEIGAIITGTSNGLCLHGMWWRQCDVLLQKQCFKSGQCVILVCLHVHHQ